MSLSNGFEDNEISIMANMIVKKHQFSKIKNNTPCENMRRGSYHQIKKEITIDDDDDILENHVLKNGNIEKDKIQKFKKSLAIKDQQIKILNQNCKNNLRQIEELVGEKNRYISQNEELSLGNNILKKKAFGNQEDFIEVRNELVKSKMKYQELQTRFYKILEHFPILSHIDPNNESFEVKVPGKIIDFTYNQKIGNRTGAKVIVDCAIAPMLFAFNQFYLNYSNAIDVDNWDKVIIFCPGGLSNVNNLIINQNVTIKLITNPEKNSKKKVNTIGIIEQ